MASSPFDELRRQFAEVFQKYGGPNKHFQLKDFILEKYGSFENLERQAHQKRNHEAKIHLSWAYEEGIPELNVEEDIDKAIGWMEASIDAKGKALPSEKLSLATLYDRKGTLSSQREAHKLYHEAAKFGSVTAELNLAESYRYGVEGVVDVDLEEAFKWYKRAVDEAPVDFDSLPLQAQIMRGTSRQNEKEKKINALTILHKCYLKGECPEGKPQQLKAIHYLKKAAELGHVDSQVELGMTYLKGLSEVPKNVQEAKRWLGKAADKGNEEAKEILDKLNTQQDAIEPISSENNKDKEHLKNNAQQFVDTFKEQCERSKGHPFFVQNPMVYLDESVFTRYPDSPTAQRYLRAYQKARDGLQKLKEGNFKEAVKLMAHSYLYENTMLGTFPEMKSMKTRITIIYEILEELKVNSKFFEGLLLLLAIPIDIPRERSETNFHSFKLDFKKTMFIKNFIHLIENDDREVDPECNFEDNYKSWLHVLYWYLGTLYTIAEEYDKGALAFEKAVQLGKLANPKPLKYCPEYFDALAGFGYCLSHIYSQKISEKHGASFRFPRKRQHDVEQSLKTYFKYQRVPENSFHRWNVTDLGEKAKEVHMEYLKTAPVCEDKYPDVHYHLAFHFLQERNVFKAREWKAKGEDAEEKRLPFKGDKNIGAKDALTMLDMLPVPDIKKCDYKECLNSEVKQLKNCPCKQVSYCGRDCQTKDWKEHKKFCTQKKSKKNK